MLACALVGGIILALFSMYKSRSHKSFYIATTLLPVATASVIALVNGNIGYGVAIAGAFGLVRFRSAQGNGREICTIFIAMGSGLAFGMGYITYGLIFVVFSGLVLLVLSHFNIFEPKMNRVEKTVRITIPEDLDYRDVFNDVFEKYLVSQELIRVKLSNMGSMFVLTYEAKFKDIRDEKNFIDEIRCRNGNLEVMVSRREFEETML